MLTIKKVGSNGKLSSRCRDAHVHSDDNSTESWQGMSCIGA